MLDPFATVEELELYLQRGLAGEQITAAELLLDLASGVIRDYTGQAINFIADDAVTVDPLERSGRVVLLAELPVTAVSVEVDAEPFEAFTVDKAAGILTRTDGRGWPDDVEVVYSHGYVEIPASIRQVCLQAATRALTNPQGIQSERLGQYSITYTEGFGGSRVGAAVQLTGMEMEMLDRFRVRR